jgi:hypothetical protein
VPPGQHLPAAHAPRRLRWVAWVAWPAFQVAPAALELGCPACCALPWPGLLCPALPCPGLAWPGLALVVHYWRPSCPPAHMDAMWRRAMPPSPHLTPHNSHLPCLLQITSTTTTLMAAAPTMGPLGPQPLLLPPLRQQQRQ